MKSKIAIIGGIAAVAGFCGGRYLFLPDPLVSGSSITKPSDGRGTVPGRKTFTMDPAIALNLLPPGLDKTQRILSLIDSARTEAEFKNLFTQFLGDETAEAAVAAHWAHRDPAACLAFLKTHQGDFRKSNFHMARTLFRTWSNTDPEAAFAAAVEAKGIPGFKDCAFEVIESALQRDFKLGGKLMAQLPDVPAFFVFPPTLWQVDPAGFAKAVLPEGTVPNQFLANALSGPLKAWATKDPAGLLTWLQSMPVDVMASLLPGAMVGLAAHDPLAASKLISQIPSASARELAAGQLAKGWVAKDAVAAFTFAASQLGADRKKVFKAMAKSLVTQGAATVGNVLNQIPAGPARAEAITLVSLQWLDEDPNAASQWLSSMAPGTERVEAMNSVAIRWAENSPEAALQFMRTNPAPELNEVYQRIVARHAGDNPAGAVNQVLNQAPERIVPGLRAAFNMMSNEYQLEDAADIVRTLPNQELQVEAVRSFMEPFATGLRLLDEGIKWAAALPAGPMREAAKTTLLQSSLLNPTELAKVQSDLK